MALQASRTVMAHMTACVDMAALPDAMLVLSPGKSTQVHIPATRIPFSMKAVAC